MLLAGRAEEEWIPSSKLGQWFKVVHRKAKQLVEVWWFEKFMIMVVVLNGIMIMVDIERFSYYVAAHQLDCPEEREDCDVDLTKLQHVSRDAIFLVVYWVEVLVRTSATGWREYWNNLWFRFDFCNTFLCTIVFVLDLTYDGGNNTLHWVLVFRQFRVVRCAALSFSFSRVYWAGM